MDIKDLQYYLNLPLRAIRLAFHQHATNGLGRNLLGGAGEEGVWVVLGNFGRAWWLWEWLWRWMGDG